MASVTFENVSKRFRHTVAADNHNFEIKDKEFFVLLGPTGVGKTTLLRLVAGLDMPDEGDIKFNGKSVSTLSPADRDTTFVFQQYSLYPHMSVYDNMAFPLRSPKLDVTEEEIKQRITDISKVLNISHKLENKATALSGGEMQRVAIGRSLVRDPSIFLMDEPLSSLDAKLRSELRVELKRIHRELGATLLYVTHDQIEAMSLADRIGVMGGGQLLQIGTPKQIYEDPDSIYVAQKLGQPTINILDVKYFDALSVPKGATQVGIRTENIRFLNDQPDEMHMVGKVLWVENLGDQNILHLMFKEQSLQILAPSDLLAQRNEEVRFTINNPLFFDSEGKRIRN